MQGYCLIGAGESCFPLLAGNECVRGCYSAEKSVSSRLVIFLAITLFFFDSKTSPLGSFLDFRTSKCSIKNNVCNYGVPSSTSKEQHVLQNLFLYSAHWALRFLNQNKRNAKKEDMSRSWLLLMFVPNSFFSHLFFFFFFLQRMCSFLCYQTYIVLWIFLVFGSGVMYQLRFLSYF